MAEKFDLEYALQFSTSGENAAADALRTVEGLMTDLASKVEGAGSTFEKLAGNLATAENALRGVSSQARESAGSWDTFSAKVEASQKALESLMQTAAADGVQNPFESISQLIGDDEIDAFERSQDAQTNALQRASQARQEIRKQEADLAVAELQREQAIRDRELSELQNAIQERARAEARGREQTNQTVIQSGEELDRIQQQSRTQELSDLRSAIQERSNIQEQGYREVADSARRYYEEIDSLRDRDRQRELASIRQGMQERARAEDERVREVSGRNYNNLSVQLDQEIESRRQASSVFAQESKARWESIAATEAQEVATRNATGAIEGMTGSLPTMRYALYDVAQTAGIVSGAITAMGAAMVVASTQYETAFTTVERTSGVTGDAVGELRDDFLQLSREIPQTFAEISNIGARGAQLGVANDQLSAFTDTVAQFVATSDTVTLDQAVEAFGRISNLLGDTDFNRIGSAITLVGVNAAATEAQIVKTTQELAPFATAVGMATSDVIALATAMGSLGQPPERARSAFLTLQRVMDTSIASGSENLESFARLLGSTTEEVETLWKQDPGEFVAAFARSLGGVEDLTTAFANLGINERRAVQVFQALAADARNAGDGMSVLELAMSDAAQGYAEGTELARQYGLIVDDLASKWQIFQNAVMELVSSMGDALAPALKAVLDIITPVVQALADFAGTPVGAVIVGIASTIGVLVATLAAVVSGVALFTASLFAAATAMRSFNIPLGTSIFSLSSLKLAFDGVTASAGISAGALRAFRVALISTGIGAAVVALGALINAFTNAGTASENAFSSFIGSSSGLSDAIKQDMKEYSQAVEQGNTEAADAFQKLSWDIEQNTTKVDESRTAYESASVALGLTEDSANRTSLAIQDLTNVMGANTQAWIKNQLVQSEGFQNLAVNGQLIEYMNLIGASMDELITIVYDKGADAGVQYLQGLEDAFISKAGVGWEDGPLGDLFANIDLTRGMDEFLMGLEQVSVEAQNSQIVMEALGLTAEDTGLALEDAGMGADAFKTLIEEMNEAVFGAANDHYALQDALYNLGVAFADNGAVAAFSGQTIQEAISLIALQSGDAGTAAANLQVLYDFILANSSATAQDLMLVAQAIANLQAQAGAGTFRPTLSAPDFSSFTTGFDNAMRKTSRSAGRASKGVGKAAKEMREELRSVSDYANDLQKVFSRAFEIRFGVRQSRDTTSSLLIKMREDAAAAQERVSDLRREIQGLNADLGKIDNDLSTQRYFLSIAVEYEDTARAEAIQANIAKLEADRAKTQADLAKTSKDLKDAQEATSTSLQGNSKYAIKNRETLDQLFESYQDQLVALANSGASQEEVRKASQRLREDFIKQATQLGYNVNELGEYEAAFRGLTTIIEQVPRNVSARLEINGLKPAVAALREFQVAAEEAQKAASKLGGGPSGGPGGVPSFTPNFTPTTQGLNIPYSYFPRDSQQLINQLNMDIAKGAHTVESAAQALGVSVGEATAMGIKTQADAQASSIIFGVNSGKSGAKKAGSDVGSATGTSMSGATAGVTSKLIPTGLVSSILGGQTASNQSGSQVGTSTGSAFSSSASSSARRGVPGGFKSAVDGSRRQARDGASSVGSAAGTSFSSGAGSGARRNFGGTISSAIFSAQFAVAREATNLGRTFASSITSSIRGSFNTALGVLSMARRIVRSITGFADGGYTGSGGKYEPAGIVHRGEYVIPKRDVNQATGMPYADALGRLMHGQRGYANGGSVRAPRGSSNRGIIDLSPSSLQALAQLIPQYMVMNGEVAAKAVNSQFAHEHAAGAY